PLVICCVAPVGAPRPLHPFPTRRSSDLVAFPAISCGVYGYPVEQASRVAMDAVAHCAASRGSVEVVRFVLFSGAVLAAFDAALEDRKSTRLNSSHVSISYAVFCLKKKNI